jgi:hypothetical protein
LRAYSSVSDARASLSRYLIFYNAFAPIRALTRERQTTPTSTTRRNEQQHEFHRHETNRQVIHLSKAKRCLEQADQL